MKRHPDNKYFKISIWLSGGGKITKIVDAESIDSLNWIKSEFIKSMVMDTDKPYLSLDEMIIRYADISAIDIEEKTDPLKDKYEKENQNV